MRRVVKIVVVLFVVLLAGLVLYGVKGWYDARSQGEELAARAQSLIADGKGGEALGADRLALLLKVQDPGFYAHGGVDLATPGAGLTTIPQSLAKRLAFERFRPGLGKIRQTGYAIGLSQVLTKPEQLALFLDTVEMGESPDGWVTGFFKASQVFYGKPPAALDNSTFHHLVAVLIAPGRLRLAAPDAELEERVARIGNLAAGRCEPQGLTDVWLEACGNEAAAPQPSQ